MKVLRFFAGTYFYAVAAKTETEAKEYLLETVGEMDIDKVEEIPESEWDKKEIIMYEDNDTENDPFYVSIREEMYGEEPQIIYTNDRSLWD